MMRSRTPLAVPIDERATRVARRRAAYRPPRQEIDTSLWSGILFWLGFTTLAIIAGL